MTKRFRHSSIIIAIPAYNEEAHIGEAIASLKAQDWPDFLALICDNGSTDRTGEICREAIAGDPRFNYLRHPENRGAAFNFNYAFDISDSPYFMWLGAHDKIAPTYLGEHLRALEANPDFSLSYCLTQWIDETGAPLQITRASDLGDLK